MLADPFSWHLSPRPPPRPPSTRQQTVRLEKKTVPHRSAEAKERKGKTSCSPPVHSTDLVDILSKGSNPAVAMLHIGKIIMSLEAFDFDSQDESSKTVKSMLSKEDERVSACST